MAFFAESIAIMITGVKSIDAEEMMMCGFGPRGFGVPPGWQAHGALSTATSQTLKVRGSFVEPKNEVTLTHPPVLLSCARCIVFSKPSQEN